MRKIISLSPLLFLVAQLAAKTDTWPVFAFQNGVHFKTVKERINVLKELGYDGIGSAKLSQSDLPLLQRLKTLTTRPGLNSSASTPAVDWEPTGTATARKSAKPSKISKVGKRSSNCSSKEARRATPTIRPSPS